MKNVKRILCVLLLACSSAVIFSACTRNEHKKITADYAKQENVDESEISFTCYAEFNGAHIIIFDGIYAQALSSEIVDDIVFQHSECKTFHVYKDGKFCSLQEAFYSGLITRDNLLTLRDAYNPQHGE